MLVGGEPGPWGPKVQGGTRHRRLWRVLSVVGVLALVLVSAGATTGYLLYQQADANLTRVAVGSLEEVGSPSDARHFLVVGSDDRAGLTAEQQRELTLGREDQFEGQRSDTMIYVTVSADQSQVTLVSIPRDLVVEREDGTLTKVTNVFAAGPEAVVEALGRTYGLPVNHYAKISIGGFLDVVDTLGGVDIELDEPLVDRKSGANFTEPGVHRMDAADALAFVRSRQEDAVGDHGDYARINRQQTFIRAVLGELTSAGRLANPAQLLRLVEDVSSHLTTDDGFTLGHMRFLADELRDAVREGVPMRTFPSYAINHPGSSGLPRGSYVMPYESGAAALTADIRSGEPLPQAASREQAGETTVAVVSGRNGTAAAQRVGPTLIYAAFDTQFWSAAPEALSAGARTVVYPATPGKTTQAGWVAALLGAEVRPLPAGVERRTGTDVIVAVGDDAAGVEFADDGSFSAPSSTGEGP